MPFEHMLNSKLLNGIRQQTEKTAYLQSMIQVKQTRATSNSSIKRVF